MVKFFANNKLNCIELNSLAFIGMEFLGKIPLEVQEHLFFRQTGYCFYISDTICSVVLGFLCLREVKLMSCLKERF